MKGALAEMAMAKGKAIPNNRWRRVTVGFEDESLPFKSSSFLLLIAFLAERKTSTGVLGE